MKNYIYSQQQNDFGTHYGPITRIDVYRVKNNKPIYLGRGYDSDSKTWKGSQSDAACIIHAKEKGHRWKKRDHSLCDVEIKLV